MITLIRNLIKKFDPGTKKALCHGLHHIAVAFGKPASSLEILLADAAETKRLSPAGGAGRVVGLVTFKDFTDSR